MPTYITQLPLPDLPVGDFSTVTPLFRPATSNGHRQTTALPPTYHNTPLNPPLFDPTVPALYYTRHLSNGYAGPTIPSSSSSSEFLAPPFPANPELIPPPHQHQHHQQQHQQHQPPRHHHPSRHHHPTHPTPSATAHRWLTRINAIQQSELGASPPLAQLRQGGHATAANSSASPSSSDTTTTTSSGPSSPSGGSGGGHSRTPSGSGSGSGSGGVPARQQQHQRRRVAKQRERERQGGDLDHRGLMGGFRVLWHR